MSAPTAAPTAEPAHSILGPSSAKRWTSCTASVFLTEILKAAKRARTKKDKDKAVKAFRTMFPDQTEEGFWDAVSRWVENETSIYAIEGTMAHDRAERILRGTLKESELEEEFLCVLEYTSACKVLQNRWGGEMFIEARVPLSYYPQDKGTVDCAIIGGDRILINDYKHGIGVNVGAEDNLQLAAYGLSFLKEYEDILDATPETPVDIRIFQPRVRNGETEKVWETTVGELTPFQKLLEEKANLIVNAIAAADSSHLTFEANDDNCKFCPNKKLCPVRSAQAMEPLIDDAFGGDICDAFETIVDENPELITTGTLPENAMLPFRSFRILTPEQILAIYASAKAVKTLLKDCEQYLLDQAATGKPVPGTKIVMGRQGNRKWSDEAAVLEKALDYIPEEEVKQPAKLKSFNQISSALAEAQVPKDVIKTFEAMTTRTPGKPVLALAGDKRAALADVTDMFESIADEENYED